MRIAYLAASPVPSSIASSVHVAKMCHAMARLGHEVTLFVPQRPETRMDVSDTYRFYGVGANFEIRRVPWPAMPGRRYVSAIAMVRAALATAPTIVYGRFPDATYIAAVAGLPVVFESHLPPASTGIEVFIHRRLLRHPGLRRLVLVSEALRREYAARFRPDDRVVAVIPDAADDPAGCAPVPLGSPGRLQVGYVGSLYPGKGMETISELATRCPWADFHVVGGEEEQVAVWQRRIPPPGNLRLHGYVPHGRTDGYRLACDVLLAPYQSRVEGHGGSEISKWMSPLKVFEYMATGRAIVAADLPVLREVLTDEVNALLCPPGSTDAWLVALRRLAENRQLRLRLGAEARAQFLARHTWNARAAAALRDLHEGVRHDAAGRDQ